jgi:outer membrane protein assembly factor BamB
VAITAPDTAGIIGSSLALSATAYDSGGALVSSAAVVWRALTTARGRVDSLGRVQLGPSAGDFWVTATEPRSGATDTISLHAARDGELKWTLPLRDPTPNFGGPALGPDGMVFVLTLPPGSEFAALVAVSPLGAERWRVRVDRTGHNAPVVGPDGTVYVAGRTVRAFSPQGAIRWSHVMWGASAALFITAALAPGGPLVVAGEDSPIAMDLATGDTVWGGPVSPVGAWLVPPTIDGNTVWIKKTEDSLYAFNLATGQIGRRIADPDTGLDKRSFGAGPVPVGSILLVPTRYRLAAFDTSGALRWLTANRGSGMSEPAIDAAGNVYVQDQADGLWALNPATGAQRWRRLEASPRWIWYGGPALAQGGTIYCAAGQGFYAYNTSGTLLWSYQTTPLSSFTGAPVIAPDGTVYTYTDTALYAFWGLNPPEPNSPWPMWRHDAQRTGRAR